jgi:hypothetical protein
VSGPIFVSLVIVHILLAVAWLALSVRLQAQVRAQASEDPGVRAALGAGGTATVRAMTGSIVLFYVVAITVFILGGGVTAYGPPYHTSLTLGLLLVVAQVALVAPGWKRLAGGDAAGAKRIKMGLGIGHLLWVVLLVLMFFGPKWGALWTA